MGSSHTLRIFRSHAERSGVREPQALAGVQLQTPEVFLRVCPVEEKARQDPDLSLPRSGSGVGEETFDKSYDYVLEPSPVALPLIQPQQTRVVQVSCGRAHSLVLTDQEGVFSMGNNAYGQCGRTIVEEEVYREPRIHGSNPCSTGVARLFSGVACGQDHSLFLTDTGKVFSCGWGADGQTGLGHHSISSCPVEVGGDLAGVEVQQISTYGDCSLAVSRDGQLFGWGNSEYRQLALATESTQMNSPRHLPLKGCGKVVQAACGGTQVAVLNERGEVFVWGYGILGKGPKLSESSSPELIPPTLFGRSEFSPSAAVVRIRCGLSHFAAVTDRGELFVWGKNIRGCLGIGKKDDQFFPWRVTVPGQVVDVACGVDHMVALVKSLLSDETDSWYLQPVLLSAACCRDIIGTRRHMEQQVIKLEGLKTSMHQIDSSTDWEQRQPG
ncbi:RCC1-like G exchanging factor-like protein [Crenichthys baileyi]|uniref:RCC1-like G exchanging factor-like protein n=1 Tax=Crenichthys baileyi TaxID=28760 RepID=A0AAV9S4Q9_9TELE